MLRKFSVLRRVHKRWLSAKPMVEIDEAVNQQLENAEYHPKRHPGIANVRTIDIPEWVQKGIIAATGDESLKNLRKGGDQLALYLNQRRPPPDEQEVREKLSKVKETILKKIDTSKLTHEEMDEFWKRNSSKVKFALKQNLYAWAAMEYDAYRSLLYMVGRAAQDYAVLHQIFNEISRNDKEFKPKALFDFGSGVGTVVWAASRFWQQSLIEYYCVDSSGDMNNLAESIVENSAFGLKNKVHHRQFLPATDRIKSDLVVSAYSLLEMPTAEARLQLILNLWQKTDKYLIIVEQGTNAGFRLVNEARDFILEMSNKSLETEHPNPCHVFAPCPHDLICPRYVVDRTPCNFATPYLTLPVGQNPEKRVERYSYVIMKRGERSEDDQQWPRLVRPTLIRSKHTICRMCTAAGKLEEVIFTAAKHGKQTYRCAKYSDWGDKLPVRLLDNPNTDDEPEVNV